MSRKKIGYISDHIFPRTSTDTEQIVSMISALAKIGHDDITLIMPRDKSEREDTTAKEIAAYYSVNANFQIRYVDGLHPMFRGLVKIFHPLFTILEPLIKNYFDLFYTRNIPALLAILLFSNKPIVFETYRPWPSQNYFAKILFKIVQRQKKLLGIITHSQFAAASYIKNGMNTQKVLIAHNGIWTERFEDEISKEEARRKLNLRLDGIFVTYTGRVNKEKGLRIVLNLAKKFPQVDFLIVGSESRGVIEQEAEHLDNVQIYPWQDFDDLLYYLYASDILIIPPTTAPLNEVGNTVLPMKTFKYMASKRAILAPDSPDIAEVLSDDINAKLSQPDNLASISEALKFLIDKPAKRQELAKKAYQDVMNLSWENRAIEVSSFIDERIQGY